MDRDRAPDIAVTAKRHSAVRINKRLQRSGTLWQAESFDHIVRNDAQLDHFREYIKDNPNKAHLPPKEFLYHKADWLQKVGGE